MNITVTRNVGFICEYRQSWHWQIVINCTAATPV